MRLLSDTQLKSLIIPESPPPGSVPLVKDLPKHADCDTHESPIQPCSVDLHIGCIVTPADPKRPIRRIDKAGGELTLETGHTAVVTTRETLNMPSNIAGIGFPPSHVSIKGLLMTNPGHVDPGYVGPMHFTVINMAKEPYGLRVGDAICTLLFFELDSPVGKDYASRGGAGGGLSDDDVNRLSRDFVNVENRAKKIADRAVRRASSYAVIFAAAVTLFGQFVPYWLGGVEEVKGNLAIVEKDIEQLRQRVDILQADTSTGTPPSGQEKGTTGQEQAIPPGQKQPKARP